MARPSKTGVHLPFVGTEVERVCAEVGFLMGSADMEMALSVAGDELDMPGIKQLVEGTLSNVDEYLCSVHGYGRHFRFQRGVDY